MFDMDEARLVVLERFLDPRRGTVLHDQVAQIGDAMTAQATAQASA